MNTKDFIDQLFRNISCDSRLHEGIFNESNDLHMEAFREHASKLGIDETTIIEMSNAISEGKYPERQAYNVNGLLVTFPTPEYKAAAIAKGTHFETNPKTASSNLFQPPTSPTSTDTSNPTSPSPAPQEPTPASAQSPAPQATPETSTEQPSTPEPDTRTPEEKSVDAKAVEQMLTLEEVKAIKEFCFYKYGKTVLIAQ
jgi:hypothetical protein